MRRSRASAAAAANNGPARWATAPPSPQRSATGRNSPTTLDGRYEATALHAQVRCRKGDAARDAVEAPAERPTRLTSEAAGEAHGKAYAPHVPDDAVAALATAEAADHNAPANEASHDEPALHDGSATGQVAQATESDGGQAARAAGAARQPHEATLQRGTASSHTTGIRLRKVINDAKHGAEG